MLGSGLNCQPPKYKQILLLPQHTRVMTLLSSWLNLAEQDEPPTASLRSDSGSHSMCAHFPAHSSSSLLAGSWPVVACWRWGPGSRCPIATQIKMVSNVIWHFRKLILKKREGEGLSWCLWGPPERLPRIVRGIVTPSYCLSKGTVGHKTKMWSRMKERPGPARKPA